MTVATKIADLNQRMLKAEEAGLKDDLAKLLHKEFTIIRANGVKQDRQPFLDAVPDNAYHGRIAENPEIRICRDCVEKRIRIGSKHLTFRHTHRTNKQSLNSYCGEHALPACAPSAREKLK